MILPQTRLAIVSVCICLASIGFVSMASASDLEPISAEKLEDMLESLQHVPLSAHIEEKETSKGKSCVWTEADIPVVNPNTNKVKKQKVMIGRPTNVQTAPVILVVPTIVGYHSALEGHIGQTFCENGMATIISDINDPTAPVTMPSWETEDANHRWALHALQTIIDYASTGPGFDPNRIGIMGLSLGGITTAMLAGIDHRLKGVFLAAAGGDFPKILAFSQHNTVVGLRKRRMEYLKITDQAEYEKVLRTKLFYDPLYLSKFVPQGLVMMMSVRGDTRVPVAAQSELWDALGHPPRFIMTKGHAGSIIQLAYTRMSTVINFMRERFGMKTETVKQPKEKNPSILSWFGLKSMSFGLNQDPGLNN